MLVKKLNLGSDHAQAINSVFAIASKSTCSKSRNHDDKLCEDIYLVFESGREKEKTRELAGKVVQEPPLSKFGIQATIHLVTKEEFISEQCRSPSFDHDNLWLYAKGVTYMFRDNIAFNEWIDLSKTEQWKEFFKKNIPPIISNIRIRQAVPSTWFPRYAR
jgi:hypothetical protein